MTWGTETRNKNTVLFGQLFGFLLKPWRRHRRHVYVLWKVYQICWYTHQYTIIWIWNTMVACLYQCMLIWIYGPNGRKDHFSIYTESRRGIKPQITMRSCLYLTSVYRENILTAISAISPLKRIVHTFLKKNISESKIIDQLSKAQLREILLNCKWAHWARIFKQGGHFQ